METLKKIINVLVMVYLLVAFLFLLRILSVDKFVALFDMASDTMFYNRMLWAGVILLLAELLVENAYIATLRKGLEREHLQLTQLKAQLYDQRMKAAAPTPTPAAAPTLTPPQPDPGMTRSIPTTPVPRQQMWNSSADDNQEPIITPAPIPPTVNPSENPNLPPDDHRPL